MYNEITYKIDVIVYPRKMHNQYLLERLKITLASLQNFL